MKQWLKNISIRIDALVKGFFVGSSMSVPGVSGGTMAMILGIYDELISSVSTFTKQIKRNFFFLLQFLFGACIGIFLLASVLGELKEKYPIIVMYFFIGAIFGSVPMLCKKANVQKFNLSVIIYPLIGILIVLLFGLLPGKLFDGSIAGIGGILIQIGGGLIAAVALVLPGISFSHMMLMMGLYDALLLAIKDINIPAMIGFVPLAIGLFLGIILFTKLLDYVMKKFPFQSYLIIFGFVIGSVANKEVFPGLPRTFVEWVISIFVLVIGFILMFFISKREARIESSKVLE